VHSDELGLEEDWRCVLPSSLPYISPAAAKSKVLALHRNLLLDALRGWMRMGSLHPWLWRLDGKMLINGADLFAKLSLELAFAVSRTKAPTVCSVCGRQYDAMRKPPKGRPHYCGDPACQREAARLRKEKSRRGIAGA
jgi:hypothetical protein